MNEDYLINQINHLRAVIDEIENQSTDNQNIYSIVNETIDETFWVTDLNLNFNFVSASIKKILGYSYEELSSESLENFLETDSTILLKEKLQEEIQFIKKNPQNNPDHFERLVLNFKHKNNMSVWCEVKIRFLLNDKSEPVSILGTTKDITEQKLIEENLYKKLNSNDNKLTDELSQTKLELAKAYKKIETLEEEIRILKNK